MANQIIVHCKCLQAFTGTLRGVFCKICRENSVIFTDCRGIAGKICKYYRVFPADIAWNPCRVPVNPCKHLQCTYWVKKLGTVLVTSWPLLWIFRREAKIGSCKNSLSISTPNMIQGGPKCKSGTQFAKSYKVRAHPTAYRPVWETSIFHTNQIANHVWSLYFDENKWRIFLPIKKNM